MKIEVCCAFTCRQKGAEFVMEELENCIRRDWAEDRVELVRHYCMGMCYSRGVCVRAGGETHTVSPSDAKEFYETEIRPKI